MTNFPSSAFLSAPAPACQTPYIQFSKPPLPAYTTETGACYLQGYPLWMNGEELAQLFPPQKEPAAFISL